MTGPACGNNPNYRMSDGDRQAVDSFRAYLTARATLNRVRTVLETEAVVGRTALEYRGLIAAALMADETAATETPAADLPARLEAALTERYTELRNPFAEMRRHEQGPDGWPASRPVGPHHVAETLRELLREQQPAIEQPFVPPVHYRRDDGVDCCVHAIPVGPDSCRACRELADAEAAAGAQQAETERCAHCNHPMGDHDGRADHRAKYPPHVAEEPWCHACNAPCDYAAGARQDGAQP
ncbi:hypothetical protein ACWDBT_27690 [Streptomyces ardesiacus]